MSILFAVVYWMLLPPVLPLAAAPDSTLPVEVDFAPLPCGQTDFAIYYKFHTHADYSVGGVRHIDKESKTEVRDVFFTKLKEDGWDVRSVGTTKLVIYRYKDDPLLKVEFKVDTFKFKPKGNVTPTVRRVRKL